MDSIRKLTTLDQLKALAQRSKTELEALDAKIEEITGTGYVTGSEVDGKIKKAVDDLIGGAPDTYNTLKEIADYIESDKSGAAAMTAEIAKKVDKVEGSRLMTETEGTKLAAIAEGATKVAGSNTNGSIKINDADTVVYTHPTSAAGAQASGLYKITTDANGHVTAAEAVTSADIAALGVKITDTTYTDVTANGASGLMSGADKAKLDSLTVAEDGDVTAMLAEVFDEE